MTVRGMINKRVVDTEGVELGVVSKVEFNHIEVSEGMFDELLLGKQYIGEEKEDQIILKDTLYNILEGMNVEGSDCTAIGTVKETVTAGDVLDTIIIETEDKKLFFITLEEIYKIDEKMTLDLDMKKIEEDGRLEE
jgi:sporulation protein YlmC with PRC-barrel domain